MRFKKWFQKLISNSKKQTNSPSPYYADCVMRDFFVSGAFYKGMIKNVQVTDIIIRYRQTTYDLGFN